MAKWGQFVWGDGTKWGRGAGDALYNALAEPAPLTGNPPVPWRRRQNSIWTFDPTTWLQVTEIPYVMPGASRTASRIGVGFEQQTLSFQLANAPYFLTGPAAGLIEKGVYLCIQRTVSSPTASTTFIDGVFQLDSAPSVDAANDGATLSVTAVDWAQPKLAPATGNGWVSWYQWLAYRADYLTGGGTPVNRNESYGTALASLIWGGVSPRLRIDQWRGGADIAPYPTPPTPPTAFGGSDTSGIVQVGDAGKALSGYDRIGYLWPWAETFQLTYDPDGYLRLGSALHPRDSGYLVTTDNTVSSAFPLPWERPLPRQVTKPQFTRVDYYVVPTVGTVPFGSGGELPTFFTTDSPILHASVQSWSSVNPHTGGDLQDIETVADDGVGKLTIGFPSFTAWCEYRLGQYLGAADTINLAVDSAVPPGPTGRRIRVHVPDAGVDALYQLVGYSQSLDYAAASWQLRWLTDV